MSVEQAVALASCADLALLSKDWADRHASDLLAEALTDGALSADEQEPLALRVLRSVARRVAAVTTQPRCALVCAWGATGAYGLAPPADGQTAWTAVFEPALSVATPVDTTGAGDTFNAGVIAALASGGCLADALRDGCHVAGRKVQQFSFDSLADALPVRRKRSRNEQ